MSRRCKTQVRKPLSSAALRDIQISGRIILRLLANWRLKLFISPNSCCKGSGFRISFKKDADTVVTFHDPCRLGRRSGMYEEPRQFINLVAGNELKEMENNRENGVCCGTTAWMECSSCSKTMQIQTTSGS